MIAINPDTGALETGVNALNCRFKKILTTPLTSRIKRRAVGNRALSLLGKLQTPSAAMVVQNLTLEALAEPQNGLTEFKALQCIARATPSGFNVRVQGSWQGKLLEVVGDL